MRKIILVSLVGAALLLMGCGGGGGSSKKKVKIKPLASLPDYTPRAYQIGDTTGAEVVFKVDIFGGGQAWVKYTGTQTAVIADGGTIDSTPCLLATVQISLSTNDARVQGSGFETVVFDIEYYFYEQVDGLYVKRVIDDSGTTTYGGVGTGVLSVPYPITSTSSWTDEDGLLNTVTGASSVTLNGMTLDCFEIEVNGGETIMYYNEEVGALQMVYSHESAADEQMTIMLESYSWSP